MTWVMLAFGVGCLALSGLCSLAAAVAWILDVQHPVEVLDNGPIS